MNLYDGQIWSSRCSQAGILSHQDKTCRVSLSLAVDYLHTWVMYRVRSYRMIHNFGRRVIRGLLSGGQWFPPFISGLDDVGTAMAMGRGNMQQREF